MVYMMFMVIVSFKHKRKLFYCKGSQTLEEVAQRGGRVSLLGYTQNPTGHGPKQPAVAEPVLRGVVQWMISKLNYSVILHRVSLCLLKKKSSLTPTIKT